MPVSTRVRPVPSSESVSRSAVSVVVRRTVASRPGVGPGSAPSARSRTSFSDGRRTVIRTAPGKALTTIPCASNRSASGSSVTRGEETRRGRRAVVARGDERRPKPLALRGRRFDIPESWLTQRRRCDRGGRARDRSRGTPLGENRGGLGVRERVADPQRREPERLRHRPHDDEVLELVDPRGARAITELQYASSTTRIVSGRARASDTSSSGSTHDPVGLFGLQAHTRSASSAASTTSRAVKRRRDPVQRIRRLGDGCARPGPRKVWARRRMRSSAPAPTTTFPGASPV